MQNLIRKSLTKREKSFENNTCPEWLLNLLPNRIKSIELIEETDEQSKVTVDLSPYQLNNSIPQLNSKLICSNESSVDGEYPNENSIENQLFDNYFQLIYSLSNQQLKYLLKKFQDNFQEQSSKDSSSNRIKSSQCSQQNCTNKTIPLTNFCQKHFIENDSKQILFSKCSLCQELICERDNKHLLHFCSYQQQ